MSDRHYTDGLDINAENLFENPTPRLAVAACLDGSPSMEEEDAIDELNVGLAQFYRSVQADDLARHAVEVAVVGFFDQATTIRDFEPMENAIAPKLDILGAGTSLGSGVELALDLLDARIAEYKAAGLEYYQPWLLILTDGQPTDRKHVDLAPRVERLVNAERLTVFPVWVGGYEDVSALAMMSPKRPPLRLKGLNFSEFFAWISRSLGQASRSRPGDKVKLDTTGIEKWAEI